MTNTAEAKIRIDTFACIRTRYVGPTDTKGSRVSVCSGHNDDRRRLLVNWDDRLNSTENHYRAAARFLEYHIENSVIRGPGLAFRGDYYWTWERKTDEAIALVQERGAK